MTNAISEFRKVLENNGLKPGDIVPNGKLFRCSSNGFKGDKAGYYAFFENHFSGVAFYGGYFGDWREGLKETWLSEDVKKLSAKDQQEHRLRLEAARIEAEDKRAKEQGKAADCAQKIWEQAKQATNNHPYLGKKKVQSYGLKITKNGQLIVPVKNSLGMIVSLQYIDKDGNKKFMAGGSTKDKYFPIKGNQEAFYVCEGYATGASIHQATGGTVLCAFYAGNLKGVSRIARKHYPDAKIIIAGDNDQWTKGNPGKAKAKEAAQEIDGFYVLPKFKLANLEESTRPTDFNDLANLEGLEEVQAQLQGTTDNGHFPFKSHKRGVYFLEEDKDGAITPSWLCSPLEVLAVTHNEHNEQWGRLLKVVDRNGLAHTWAMPLRMTRGSREDFLEELYDMGLVAAPGRKAGDRIRRFISEYPTNNQLLCVDRIGWHGESFALPDKTFAPSARSKPIVFQGECRVHNFKTKGSLEQWQTKIGQYAVGNSRLALALSVALSGPLLHLVHAESGGFHFVGDTSAGKSTMLLAAGSVCGGGIDGFHKQWRSTDNALEAIAAAHCDTFICLDEIGQCEGRVVSEASYMLANGQGKQRLSKGAVLKEAYTWRVVFLSTGEASCIEKIMESGVRVKAGQEIRVLDIPALPDSGYGVFETLHGFKTGAALADHIASNARSYYGHPLRAFLSRLVLETDQTIQQAGDFIPDFVNKVCPKGSSNAIKRACKRFAVAAFAGGLATKWDIFPWPENQGAEAAALCFQSWIKARGGEASMDAIHGLKRLKNFIQVHGSSRFEIEGQSDMQKVVNRAGFKIKDALEGWTYLIYREVFKSEICAGLDVRQVLYELERNGILSAYKQFREPTNWEKRSWFYFIPESKLYEKEERNTGEAY